MAASRKAAEDLSELRSRVLREVGDPDGDRWSVGNTDYTDVDGAINDQLVEMANQMAADFPGEALLRATFTYTESSAPVELPAAVGAEAIYKIEDVSSANLPINIEYISPLAVEDYDPGEVFGSYYKFRYTLLGPSGADVDAYRIQLYPKASGSMTLRVSYIEAPFIISATSDEAPMSPRWTELISVGAALKLLRRDGEATDIQLMAHQRLWGAFITQSQRQRGPKRIRRRRRGM